MFVFRKAMDMRVLRVSLLLAAALRFCAAQYCLNEEAQCSQRIWGSPPMGTAVRCDITSDNMQVYTPGYCKDASISRLGLNTLPCRAYAGMNVSVQCVEEGSRALYVDGRFAGEGVYRVLNASSSSAATLLQCRNATNHTTAERNLTVTGAVRIIGADYDCRYFYCDADHKCCTATSVSLAVADSTRPPELTAPLFAFSVLGEGPPSLSWDVVWFNHYPVWLDLHVEKDGYYNNSLAKLLYLRGGWPQLITDDPQALVRVTASNDFSNHSACFAVVFQSLYQTITVNDSLLRNTTAEASSDAAFHVEFGYSEADAAFHFIQVSLYPSPASGISNSSCTCELGSRLSHCDCETCSFTVDIQFTVDTSAFSSFIYTVTLHNVSLQDSGTIVSLSYVRGDGISNAIQWQGNATLTVTPLSPNTATHSPSLPLASTLVSILLVVIIVATAVAVLIASTVWCRRRKMSTSPAGFNYTPLTQTNGCPTATDIQIRALHV